MDTQTQKEITAKNIDMYALWVKHGSFSEVGRILGKKPETVKYHVEIIKANQNGNSLVELARNTMIDNTLPKAIGVYDKALDNYDTKPDLAVNVATNVLKGVQVLVPKTQEDKTTRKLELNVKADVIAQELGELLGLDTSNAVDTNYTVIDDNDNQCQPDKEDPPAGGPDSDDRVCSDS